MNPKIPETLESWSYLPDFDQLCTVINDLFNNEIERERQDVIDAIRKLHPEI